MKELKMSKYKEKRMWGTFENLLDTEYTKVKELVIRPGEKTSYQYHYKRSEVWIVVQGELVATLDDVEKVYKYGDIVDVPVGTKHRVANKQKEELKYIEVQTGTYFGEDDIVRLEDDYGREGTSV